MQQFQEKINEYYVNECSELKVDEIVDFNFSNGLMSGF